MAATRLGLYGGPRADLLGAGISISTAALTGTATDSIGEEDVATGGKTIIITLTNATWVASGATFDAQRQNIIDGITADGAETDGWNNIVRDSELDVTDVARITDTVVTVTLPAAASYDITADETITVTVPASAISEDEAIVASPTFTVTRESTLRWLNTDLRHKNVDYRHNDVTLEFNDVELEHLK